MKSESIWLTWEQQTRNSSMAKKVGAECIELISNKTRVFRYIILTAKTIIAINRKRPKVIFYQNPSIILALLCTLIKLILRSKIKVVGDFHNIALEPGYLSPIHHFITRHTDITIVTNSALATEIVRIGGRPIVFPDPLPEINFDSNQASIGLTKKTYILLICSWSNDEPIEDIFSAYLLTRDNGHNVPLVVTGKPKESILKSSINSYQKNGIVMTGFVSKEDYFWLVSNAAFNIDLTTRDNCMVCGAYESVSANVPILLSNNIATMTHFEEAAIYTDNSVLDIERKIRFLMENHEKITLNIKHQKDKIIEKESIYLNTLNAVLK